MPRFYDEDEPRDYDEQDRNAASSERISNMRAFHDHELMNDVEPELGVCPTCGFLNNCNCSDEFDDEENEDSIADISPEVRRYIDKEINDEEY